MSTPESKSNILYIGIFQGLEFIFPFS